MLVFPYIEAAFGNVNELLQQVVKGLRPRFNERVPDSCHDFAVLASQCWAEKPTQRPTFDVIQQRLEAMLHALKRAGDDFNITKENSLQQATA